MAAREGRRGSLLGREKREGKKKEKAAVEHDCIVLFRFPNAMILSLILSLDVRERRRGEGPQGEKEKGKRRGKKRGKKTPNDMLPTTSFLFALGPFLFSTEGIPTEKKKGKKKKKGEKRNPSHGDQSFPYYDLLSIPFPLIH